MWDSRWTKNNKSCRKQCTLGSSYIIKREIMNRRVNATLEALAIPALMLIYGMHGMCTKEIWTLLKSVARPDHAGL